MEFWVGITKKVLWLVFLDGPPPPRAWKVVLGSLSLKVPTCAHWDAFLHNHMRGGPWGSTFLWGFTVFISCFLLALVLEPRDYFRGWPKFCRLSLRFLWPCDHLRNLAGLWTVCPGWFLRGPPLPRVLIKSPWTKATVFCCVHFLLSRRSSGGATLQPPEDGHPLTLAPTCAEDARELAPMCAEDACELCWSPVSPMVSDCCFSQIHLGYKCN